MGMSTFIRRMIRTARQRVYLRAKRSDQTTRLKDGLMLLAARNLLPTEQRVFERMLRLAKPDNRGVVSVHFVMPNETKHRIAATRAWLGLPKIGEGK